MSTGIASDRGFDFGTAIAFMRRGIRVHRAGWNGKGMWLRYVDLYNDREFSLRENSSARGSVDLPGLLTCLIAAILAGALLAGCPRLPPISGCSPMAQTCIDNSPYVCSSSQRWFRSGDLSCSAVGGVCTVLGGRAHCAPVADAGAADGGE
jgi:hypothetical protein